MSCSSDDQSDKECPLCMEVLELDDLDFYPCKCEYQICRFCWHRIRNDENGLCPACRQPYPEDPVNFKPLTSADLKKIRSEKKMKAQAERQRVSEGRKHLSNYRVLQKNLLYVVGLSPRVADPEILKKSEYFGRFGKIIKVVVGTTTTAPPNLNSSHTAYVTYAKVEEALRAIQSVNNAALDGRLVRASLGTTKYCSSFLRGQLCYKQECMYLHDVADCDISFTKEDMHQGKHTEYERRLIEQTLRPMPTPVAAVAPTVRTINSSTSLTSVGDDRLMNQRVQNDTSSEKEMEDGNLSIDDVTCEKDTDVLTDQISEDDPPVRECSSEAQSTLETYNAPSIGSGVTDGTVLATGRSHSQEETPQWEPDQNTPAQSSRLLSWTKSAQPTTVASDISSSAVPTWQRLLGMDGSSVSVAQPYVNGHAHLNQTTGDALLTGAPPGLSPIPRPVMSNSTQGFSRRGPSPPPGLGGFDSDDDLGFDPILESRKGLAVLLDEEKRYQPPIVKPAQPINGFSNYPPAQPSKQPTIPHEELQRQQFLASVHLRQQQQQAAALHEQQQRAQQQRDRQELSAAQEQWLRSMHFQQHSAPSQPQADFPGPQHHAGLPNIFQHNNVPKNHISPYDLFNQRPEPASVAPPPGLHPSRQSPQQSSFYNAFQTPGLHSLASANKGNSSEWQDGLRALLPNVNIRFASEHEQQQQSQNRWPNGSVNGMMGMNMHQMATSLMGGDPRRVHHHNQHIPPPPGFATRTGER
ncbi:unnamed protein product, partial [Mesorhabditis spiculigera]